MYVLWKDAQVRKNYLRLSQITKVMKLCILLLLSFCLQAQAESYSQQVTLNEKNTPLKQVLEKIRAQTGYQFLYADAVMSADKKVTIRVNRASIKETLDKCFKNTGLGYTIAEKTIVVKKLTDLPVKPAERVQKKSSFATIKGTVTTESGKALQGATVMVKGKTTATKTNAQGKFSIQATNKDALLISYIGFETKTVKIGIKRNLSIILTAVINTAEQIVVVGYGSRKKSDVTGSIASVDMDKAIAIPTTNVAEMIRGQAAGVQVTLGSARPGGSSDILIRGRNSIRGGNNPLIVMDGFPIESLNDINPDDIASIEVLKDASAQAIYGARASNGVILVTTKRGKEGSFKVTSNNYITTQKLTKNFNLYNGEEFAQLRREAVRTDNAPVNGVRPYSTDIENFGGSATSPEYINFIKGNFVDWEKEVLQTGLINSHTLSVSGGTKKTKLFTSANFFNQKGLIPTAGYQRGTFRINLEQELSKRISLDARLNLSTDKQKRESSSLDFITISPFTGPYDENGELIRNVAGANASSTTINPLWNIREGDNDIKKNLFNLNLALNVDLSKNFDYRLNTLLSRRFTDQGIYLSSLHSSGSLDKGRATLNNTIREEYLVENIFNYTGQINNNHKFEGTFVQSINQRNTSFTSTEGTNFGNDALGYDGITNALFTDVSRDEERYRLVSFMGRARYTLQNKYLLTLTSRYDGASVFAKNNKWGFFPAIDFGWQIHKENFLSDVRDINSLKLRVSYGSVGNQSLDPYTTLGTVGNYPYIIDGVIFAGNIPGTQLPNPNLTWETSTTFNAGLDFALFKNKINGTIGYFKTRTTDLLTDVSVNSTLGYTSTITNGGETENNGFEVLLRADIIRNNKFRWNVSTAFTTYRNKIIKTGLSNVDGTSKDDLGRGRFVGQPINFIRSFVFDGIFQTDAEAEASAQGTKNGTVTPFQNPSTLMAGAIRLKDVNGDGVIDDNDRTIIRTDPDWFASVSTSLNYANFDLLADFYFVEGATKINPYLSSFNQGGTLRSVRNGIKVNYWTPENPSNDFPRPAFGSNPANISALGVQDASYMRLRTLSLGYSLPTTLLDKYRMSSVRAYVTATNLFTITDYKSYSPENNPNDFPDTQSFTFGLNIGL